MNEPTSNGSDKPLFLMVLSSAYVEREALAEIERRHKSQSESISQTLLRRYEQRANLKEDK